MQIEGKTIFNMNRISAGDDNKVYVNAKTIAFFGECTADAWDYGTWAGEGNPELEYLYTNQYFEMYCNEDGSYKLTQAPGN